jgi:hypothetical protein
MMSIKRQLYRWTDSDTWRGNLTLVVLLGLALVSWFGCVPDRSGLLEAATAEAGVDVQPPPGPAPDATPTAPAPDAQLALPPDTAPTPPPPDAVPMRTCDDATNPCPVCQACKRGVCTPWDEHEACGPMSCNGTAIMGRVCHNGACAALAVVKDCATAAVCKYDDSGRPYVVPGICAKVQGSVACVQDGPAYRYCDRTCGQADGGVWECRSR